MKKCFQLLVLFVLFVFLVVVLFIGTVLVILQFAPRLLLRHTLRNNVYVVYNMNNIFRPDNIVLYYLLRSYLYIH